jgi:hypothetical protein
VSLQTATQNHQQGIMIAMLDQNANDDSAFISKNKKNAVDKILPVPPVVAHEWLAKRVKALPTYRPMRPAPLIPILIVMMVFGVVLVCRLFCVLWGEFGTVIANRRHECRMTYLSF